MYKSVTVNGEAGVKATCLLHSVAPAGVPMVTFEEACKARADAEMRIYGFVKE